MDKIRRGKDLIVRWSFFNSSGHPYVLDKNILSLYVSSSFGKSKVNDFDVIGNVVEWIFKGSNQQYLGDYSLELIENDGSDNMQTLDVVDAFALVSNSRQESSSLTQISTYHNVNISSKLITGVEIVDQFIDFSVDDAMYLNLTYMSASKGFNLDFELTDDGHLTLRNI